MTTADILAELPRLNPADLARVQAALGDLADSPAPGSVADHPAVGIWAARDDLPADPVEASAVLRRRMMRQDDAAAAAPRPANP